LKGLLKVRIQDIDSVAIGVTDIEDRFKIEIPQDSEKLLLT